MLRERLRNPPIWKRSFAECLIILSLACGLLGCSSESELKKKYTEGFDAGYKNGQKDGYEEGYNDGLNKNPKKFSSEIQNPYVNTIVYVCAALSIVVFLYWMLFIYGYYTDPRGLLDQCGYTEFYEGIWPKLLITLATVSLLLLLMPGDYIVRLNLYLNARTANQYLIIFCGIALSFIIVFIITKTTANRKPTTKIVFQWFWAILFPVIIYEMIGSFIKVQGWDFEQANYNLLLQAGMLIGPLTLLSIQRLIKQVYEFI